MGEICKAVNKSQISVKAYELIASFGLFISIESSWLRAGEVVQRVQHLAPEPGTLSWKGRTNSTELF